MHTERKKEIATVVAALTVAAALAATLTGAAANAAPPKTAKAKTANTKTAKQSRIVVRRAQAQVVVKMVGDRRAAEQHARQAYANLLAQEQARVAQQQQQAAAVAVSDYNGTPVSGASSVTLDANGNVIATTVAPGVITVPPAPGFPNAVGTGINVIPNSNSFYGGVQTITIPGNGFGGPPTVNNYGSYPGYGGYGGGGYYGSNVATGYPGGYTGYGYSGGFPGYGGFFRF